jgi:hypothetical protein
MMPDVTAQQPAITIPQSQFLGFGALPNDPRVAVNMNQLDASLMMPQPMDPSRAPWGAFTLTQGFSTNDEYDDLSLFGGEGQYHSITGEGLEHRAKPLSQI